MKQSTDASKFKGSNSATAGNKLKMAGKGLLLMIDFKLPMTSNLSIQCKCFLALPNFFKYLGE